MSRSSTKSKFGFALTSNSKKGLLTALSATTALGIIVLVVAAMYAGGNLVAAKRRQKDSVAPVARNYNQAVQRAGISPAQLSRPHESSKPNHDRDGVSFNHRRGTYSGLVNLVAPTVTASMTDSLLIDGDGDNNADPGDTLEYSVGISAIGEDANGVTFTDTVDPNTTFVSGSLTATPVAVNDSYSALGNVRISIAAPGVLGNDFAGLPSASISAPPVTSANGGNVTLNPDGSFSYNPPAGFEGVDSFSYTLSNSEGSNAATVVINVSGMIWFVNNNFSCPCDGRLTNPFNTLASFQALNNGAGNSPANNDNIFLYESTTDYVGPVTLLDGQRFVGQDATASLSSITGLTPPAGSDPFPATNSGNGVMVTITSATTGITLASGNLLRGFTGGNATADISGAMFGTLTVSDVTLNGTGQALDLNAGTLAASFDSVSSTDSATTGISLTNAAGTLTSPTTTITNSTGIGLSVNSSSAAFNFGNTNSSSSGGTGVSLVSNTGTITFGALNISPDGGQRGLFATDNTMTITAASGAVSTSGATAVEVTRVGGDTPLVLSFGSVATSGGAPNGIFLSNTSGSFTVAGSGGSCTFTSPSCSGGRITATTGANNSTSGIGIYLNNVDNVSLTGMRIDNHPNFGIRGHDVTGFTLQSSVIDGNNGTSHTADLDIVDGEDSVRIINLNGSALIDDCFIGGGYEQNLRVVNASGTLDRLTVSDSSIGDLDGAGPGRGVDNTNGDDNVNFEARTGTVMNVTMTNNILNNGRGDVIQINSELGASMDVVFRGNTVSNNHANISVGAGGAAITGLGAVTYDVSCNSFRDSHDIGLNVLKGRPSDGNAGGNWSGTIFNNKVGVTGVGSSAGFTGINVSARGNGTHTVLMKNNTVRNYDGGGIVLEVVDANTSAPAQLTLNASLVGNLVAEPNPVNAFTGLFAVQGSVPGADVNTTLNLKLGGAGAEQNNFTAGDPADFNDVFVFQGAAPEGVFNLTQGNSASLDPTTVIMNNNASPLTVFADGGQTVVPAAPPQPASISEACTPPLGSITLEASPEANSDKGSESTTPNVVEVSQTLRATQGERSSKAPALKLSETELELMTREAIARWADFGLSAGDLARMQAISTQITDLPDGELARTHKGVIEIDGKAAGFGWYFDPTPGDDSEFAVPVPNKESQATELSAAHGHVDLITVLMRQLRVAFGRKKLSLSGNQGWLMQNTISVGTRRAPTLQAVSRVEAAPIPPQQTEVGQMDEQTQPAFDGSASQRRLRQVAKFTSRATSPGTLADVMLSIGTLPAGETVTIAFRVTVANPFTAVPPQVSNQGTVSGNNFGSVLTDDPDVGGTADPTVTAIQVATVTPSVSVAVSPASTAEGGANLAYTFTRTGSTASALSVDFSVAGTAASPADYSQTGATTFTPPTGAVTFGAGSATATINVTPLGDSETEGPETVIFTLTPGAGYIVGMPSTATGTITDSGSDSTPPVITLHTTEIKLWPPNHRYQNFAVSDFVLSASDSFDASVNLSSVYILNITSDELAKGEGDGNTFKDIVIGADCKSAQVRSERSSSGDGRVYTITFKVRDASGNSTTATAMVVVPLAHGNSSIDSGPKYTVSSSCP